MERSDCFLCIVMVRSDSAVECCDTCLTLAFLGRLANRASSLSAECSNVCAVLKLWSVSSSPSLALFIRVPNQIFHPKDLERVQRSRRDTDDRSAETLSSSNSLQ